MKKSILPQYVYEFNAEKRIIEDAKSVVSNLDFVENRNNFQSINSSVHILEGMSDFKYWIIHCIHSVLRDNYIVEKVKITQCWANKSENNQFHHEHHHNNSLFSAVYYVNDHDSSTYFISRNNWSLDNSSYTILDVQMINDDQNFIVHEEKSESGKLIVFPSSLSHKTSLNESNIPRYTISLNTFPIGNFGDYGNLTGMRIK